MRIHRFGDSHAQIVTFFRTPHLWGVMARQIGRLAPLLMVIASAAHAQTPLTLDEALAKAHANNPALAAARAQADGASVGVTAARGQWFPRVTLSESATRSDQPVFAFGALLSARQFTAQDFAVGRLNGPGATNLFTTRIGVQQVVFDGGRTSAAVAETRARRDVATASSDEAAAGVALAVTRTFGQLVTLQSSARALDAAVGAATEDLTRAERRRDAGTVTDADVLAIAVHLSDLRQRRIQLGAGIAATRATLNRLMGEPVESPIGVVAVADVTLPSFSDLSTLFAEAEATRPDLRRADAEIRMATAAARQASSVWWPQVAAQAGIEWNGITAGDRARSWIVGGEVRWSVSLSGADRARVQAASHARSGAELMRQDLRAAVQVEILTAVRQLEAAGARVAVGAESVAQATERARVVRNRYDAGLASMTDVLAASSALLDAEARHTAARVDVLNAHAELRRSLGRSLFAGPEGPASTW